MKNKFSIHRYSSRYQFEIYRYRDESFYSVSTIEDVLKKKDTNEDLKLKHDWLQENHPELML